VILSFSGLCLCLVPESRGSWERWMGEMVAAGGSIVCWSTYGRELGDAIVQRNCRRRPAPLGNGVNSRR
jgi:hypothetical protein